MTHLTPSNSCEVGWVWHHTTSAKPFPLPSPSPTHASFVLWCAGGRVLHRLSPPQPCDRRCASMAAPAASQCTAHFLTSPRPTSSLHHGPLPHALLHARMSTSKPSGNRAVSQPGDLIAFNNRRMLHGRNAFNSSAHGSRWLRGCYVNIDEFSNRFNLLDKRFGEPDYRVAAHGLGNQDWGRGCIGIRAG